MDISVLAAVGSFAVSERILKPKATVLVILGCILAYDLTTKTHDVSSLRVYRGPALLAFTLMCCAYSLRTWRRNGVACDELIFLPGTPHGQNHGIDSPPVVQAHNEGDAAAGLATHEMVPLANAEVSLLRASSGRLSSQSPRVEEEKKNTTDMLLLEDEDEDASWNVADEEESTDGGSTSDEENHPNMIRSLQQGNVSDVSESSSQDSQEEDDGPNNDFRHFRQAHPRITRIGTFFFFRSPEPTENAAYAPSGPMVFGAALDLCMPILFNFHLFIEAYNHDGGEMTAKILPLIFLSVLIVRSFIPPSRRRRFWSTTKFIAMAPFHKVRFRDAFLGDVLTSLVRPIQDVLFALSYYGTVVWGIGSYGVAEAGQILEKSWFLHNVVLPSCALLPLWWKFLQTLRQCYDTNKRWPYLGDAFKYLSAAMVIIYGMTHPEDRRSYWWLICFVLSVIYQIVWDTLVDWELLVIAPPTQPVECQSPFCARISSLRPSSRILLVIQMYILQPISDGIRRVSASIPSWEQIQLRPKRLYKNTHFYWRIFIVNCLLRFTWMLCFIPAYRLSTSGEEKETTFSSDVNSYVGVLLPVAEIVRRCYWGFLKLEMETIRMMDTNVMYARVDDGEDEEEADAGSENKNRSTSFRQLLPTWLESQQKQQHDAATSSSRSRWRRMFQFSDGFRRQMFLVELSLWAVAFVGFGYWAACQ